jgi:cytochrome b561/polyisoprenoid-binding protein YceI
MSSVAANTRYNRVAMILHWLIALAIVGMIFVGWQLEDLPDGQRFALTQVHKSIGITILLLTLVRLSWRLMNPVPALPDGMKPWEIMAAKATHVGFYGLLILMPLSGWAMSSASPYGLPTILYGALPWPHLPGLSDLALEDKKEVAKRIGSVHSALAWVMIGLLVLHVGAALKHQFVNKDTVLRRMVPFWTAGTAPAAKGRGLVIALGIALSALALGVWLGRAPAPLPTALADEPAEEVAQSVVTPEAVVEAVPVPVPETPAPEMETPPEAAPAERATPQPSPAPAPAEAPTVAPAVAPSAAPIDWQVIPASSTITFSGTHEGKAFSGTFSNWRADIRFDPDNLPLAKVIVRIDMASARTGDAFYDGTLPEADWFDVKRNPEARFEAQAFRREASGFAVDGTLTLKGKQVPVSFPFALSLEGDGAVMSARTVLDRTVLGLGVQSDPNGGWVSTDISVTIALRASRKP